MASSALCILQLILEYGPSTRCARHRPESCVCNDARDTGYGSGKYGENKQANDEV